MNLKKNYSYLFHLFLWAIYTFLPVIYTYQRLSYDPNYAAISTFHNPIFWIYVSLSSIFLFYLNAFYLIPNFYKKKKIIAYWVIVSTFTSILILIRVLLRYIITTPGGDELSYYFYFNALIPYLFIFAASTAFRFFIDYQNELKVKSEIENEQLKSELSFLRSQISPHFMFNIMNSMVSLARKKSDLLEPMLIRMSELLRYMLYEKDGNKINIEKEVIYLQSYIELQKLRFGKKLDVSFETKIIDSGSEIEAMLLIPFVENAFKHGTGLVVGPSIVLYLEAIDNKLLFSVTNKISTETNENKDKSSGIGLANVKRRLLLLYPEKHNLAIKNKNDIYCIELTLLLK